MAVHYTVPAPKKVYVKTTHKARPDAPAATHSLRDAFMANTDVQILVTMELKLTPESRQVYLSDLLKKSCQNPPKGFMSCMDIHWKTKTRVWQLALRGGADFDHAVAAVKAMWAGRATGLPEYKTSWDDAMKVLGVK